MTPTPDQVAAARNWIADGVAEGPRARTLTDSLSSLLADRERAAFERGFECAREMAAGLSEYDTGRGSLTDRILALRPPGGGE